MWANKSRLRGSWSWSYQFLYSLFKASHSNERWWNWSPPQAHLHFIPYPQALCWQGSPQKYDLAWRKNRFFWFEFMSSSVIPHGKEFTESTYHRTLDITKASKWSSGKESSIGKSHSPSYQRGILKQERWSATIFSVPFLSRISSTNFCRRKIHWSKQGLESLLSLALHIISKGRLQSGGWMRRPVMKASFILRNASKNALAKTNGVLLAKTKVRGLGVLKKSLMKWQ